MTQDISNASIRSIYKRTLLPTFSKVVALVDSQKFFADTLELAKDFMHPDLRNQPDMEVNFKLFLDHELSAQLLNVMKELPADSFTYRYLALTLDFKVIQNFFTENFGRDIKVIHDEFIELEKKLLLKNIYTPAFEKEIPRLSKYNQIFDYLSRIDHLFFEILIQLGRGQNDFILNFIAHKIDTYNLTAYFRFKNFNRNDEFIRGFLISYARSISVKEINSSFVAHVLAKFIPANSLPSAPLVEAACQMRELKYLKQSMFEGIGEPAILFYLETLKTFFYNLKVLALSREMSADKNLTLHRLVNYSLTD